MGKLAPKLNGCEVADPILSRGRQHRNSRNGEAIGILPGFVPTACAQERLCEQGRA